MLWCEYIFILFATVLLQEIHSPLLQCMLLSREPNRVDFEIWWHLGVVLRARAFRGSHGLWLLKVVMWYAEKGWSSSYKLKPRFQGNRVGEIHNKKETNEVRSGRGCMRCTVGKMLSPWGRGESFNTCSRWIERGPHQTNIGGGEKRGHEPFHWLGGRILLP